MKLTLLAAAALVASIAPVAPASAQVAVVDCSSLAGHAPVTSAQTVTDSVLHKDYCDVKGVIAPQEHFEIKLPVSGWQGRYLQEGCSGLCGAVPAMSPPLTISGLSCQQEWDGELVVAADDEGHSSSDPSWATDPVARKVFGRTSEHSLAVVAKALITRYYGRPPTYSYYDGCSTGGREALVEAQRYPTDFNGIIAGAPAGNEAPLGLFQAWLARSNTDSSGHQILPAEKLPALHQAVMAQCSGDPRQCGFDPASLRCPAGTDDNNCLTSLQIAAVRAFYRGPTDEHGRNLFNGGEPYGSELAWLGEMVQPAADAAAPGDTFAATIALDYFKHMAFEHNPPANFTLADVPFTDAEFAALDRLGRSTYNANDPDLRAFQAHGGKIILWHGWTDQTIPPFSTLDYYAAVERATASSAFSRLYMLPSTYHCLIAPDGSSYTAVDFVTPLLTWVEHGAAPGDISAGIGGNTVAVPPTDALKPVPNARGLNSHYDYVGRY